jgi:RhtB (resistance to homoserine/threonine) family protein
MLLEHLNDIFQVAMIAVVMAISPGQDFAMVTRNSLIYSRRAGLWSAAGICAALWLHVAYSLAGIAVIISQSPMLYHGIKYLGAAYLLYLGVRGLLSKKHPSTLEKNGTVFQGFTASQAFRAGFICNALNPKATLFFLSIFTQFVGVETPMSLQLVYGMMIFGAHAVWFVAVSYFFSSPMLIVHIQHKRHWLERVLGGFLCALAARIAVFQ